MRRPERHYDENSERCQHHDERRDPENNFVRAVRNDVFLQQQLDSIGNRLQQPVGPDAHGTETHLHMRQDLALQPVHRDDRDREPDENQQNVNGGPEDISGAARSLVAIEVRLNVLKEVVHQRSTSPKTMSSVPITAMTSATSWPRHITSSACRFTKLGGRTRSR